MLRCGVVLMAVGCDMSAGPPKMMWADAIAGPGNVAFSNVTSQAQPDWARFDWQTNTAFDGPLPNDLYAIRVSFTQPLDPATLDEGVAWIGPDGEDVAMTIAPWRDEGVYLAIPDEVPVGPGQQLLFDDTIRELGKRPLRDPFVLRFGVVDQTCRQLPGCVVVSDGASGSR